jgi:5-methylcytosine-specific restriction endonuclease McrA
MYHRDYKKEAAYESTPEQIKKREARNRARAQLMREGLVHKGDNMDVDHRVPLVKGGSTARSNLRVRTASANRSFRRTRGAHMA